MGKLGKDKATILVVAVAVLGIATFGYLRQQRRRHAPPRQPSAEERAAAEAKAQAEREATERYTHALDAMIASNLAPTGEPCPIAAPRPPMKLGDMSLTWPGDQRGGEAGAETTSYLLVYLRNIGSDVGVAAAPSSGAPFTREAFGAPTATLIIDRWIDPIVPKDVEAPARFAVGQLEGRLVLWDRSAGAFVCGATVSASNTDVTLVHTTRDGRYGGVATTDEDPLSKVRIDLVNEAIRAGLAGPTRLGATARAPR